MVSWSYEKFMQNFLFCMYYDRRVHTNKYFNFFIGFKNDLFKLTLLIWFSYRQDMLSNSNPLIDKLLMYTKKKRKIYRMLISE